ncbi:MAG TPA: nitrous oxide reductase family maturation protein NosD, partial [Sphingobacteriaceae bacterium]|nr:nitrous oxide reductase family maturation protein NosD [Sphingobacteriaceae bacterium]
MGRSLEITEKFKISKDFILIFFLCANLMVCGMVSHAATILVGPQQKIKSLKEALELAQPYDTVKVMGGTYKEGNLAINIPLHLIGIDRPIIDGEKKHEPISIFSSHVTISGFKINNSGQSATRDLAAIKIYGKDHVIIEDNILDDNFFGIYAQDSRHCTIKNNKITSYSVSEILSGNGIHAWKSEHITIIGNEITGHRDGIYLEFVTNTLTDHNLAKNNVRYGLHFMFSHDNSYSYNTFTGNGAGVAVMYTRNVHMEYNVFDENWGDAAYGLLLKDIMDSHISNNTFKTNTTGIYMEGSNRVILDRNLFEANGWAIKIQGSCENNEIRENNFIQNTFDIATNSTRNYNTFSGN